MIALIRNTSVYQKQNLAARKSIRPYQQSHLRNHLARCKGDEMTAALSFPDFMRGRFEELRNQAPEILTAMPSIQGVLLGNQATFLHRDKHLEGWSE